MSDLPIANRRLMQGGTIIYPITSEQNIVGLKNRFPIISAQQPQGQFVERQAWLDTSIHQENSVDNGEISFGHSTQNENLSFGNEMNENLTFGEIQQNENLSFEQGEQHNP